MLYNFPMNSLDTIKSLFENQIMMRVKVHAIIMQFCSIVTP